MSADVARECQCNLRTRVVGDGCAVCNPTLAAEIAADNLADAREAALAEHAPHAGSCYAGDDVPRCVFCASFILGWDGARTTRDTILFVYGYGRAARRAHDDRATAAAQ